MAKKLIVGNWKLHPEDSRAAKKLFQSLSSIQGTSRVQVVVAPPFPYLPLLRSGKVALGAQDVFWEDKGPYTGEVSPSMLTRLGARYVIIGHSERRRWAHETDEMIAKKVFASLLEGLTVILCVGEPKSVHAKGFSHARLHVINQLRGALSKMKRGKIGKLVVAYEPIWAIGSGTADSPEETAKMSLAIKEFLLKRYGHTPRVLYGGSVTPANARRFLRYEEINGALVGGASIRPQDFKAIVHSVAL